MTKQKDYAYKWRSLKNFARIFKNPGGFASWRYLYQLNLNKGLHPWTIFISSICAIHFIQLADKSVSVRKMQNDWRYRRGMENWRLDKNSYIDYRIVTGPDTTTFKKHISNFQNRFKNICQNNIYEPFWCRDQNFRKYFEIRKRHGISPSVNENTYYNKDKAESYWKGLIEADDMIKSAGNIK